MWSENNVHEDIDYHNIVSINNKGQTQEEIYSNDFVQIIHSCP